MAHKFKVGDRVILGDGRDTQSWTQDMDRFIGKEAVLRATVDVGEEAWCVNITCWYWREKNLTLVGCPCKVNACLTHTKKKQ